MNKPHVIVDHVLDNLLDRRDIKDGFDDIDDDVLLELFATLETIVERGMKGDLEDTSCWLRPRCRRCDSFKVQHRCEKCGVTLCGSRSCTNTSAEHLVLCNDCYETVKD